MTVVLLVVLVAANIAYLAALDRKDKRHQAQLDRLLLWRHDPKTAALPETTEGTVLYLQPEDDQAWNEQHGRTERAS